MSTSKLLEQVKVGWRALGQITNGVELQSISILSEQSIKIRAGRLASDDAEIVLFRFELDLYPKDSSLPKGNGFDTGLYLISGEEFIGISRRQEGAIDLFEAMLLDVIPYALCDDSLPHRLIFRRFLNRIQEWQSFMGRSRKGLSRKNEVGLIGELFFLKELIEFNLPVDRILSWWRGPFHGVQDFRIDGFAVEVKATTNSDGFEIEVFDLDQLDPIGLDKLFLSAMKLKVSNEGETLPQIIDSIKKELRENTDARSLFETALSYSGYHEEHRNRYTMAVTLEKVTNFDVDDSFPSIRRKNIPLETTKIHYSLDLSHINQPSKGLAEILAEMGVVKWS